MYINAIYDADLQNGEGVGVTLCVSGCPIKCPGCFNIEAQNPAFGKRYTEREERQILSLLDKSYIDHLAIIGGEPITQDKIQDLTYLCRQVKQLWPQKKIWLWSGHTWEKIYSLAYDDEAHRLSKNDWWDNRHKYYLSELLENIDILVDGPFIQEQKDITLKWRGSKNQRVIRCADTLHFGRYYDNKLISPPILYCD